MPNDSTKRWDEDHLALARFWALRKSKDPSTKVGAVISRPNQSIVSLGYNGFPRGVHDYEGRLNNRDIKYSMTVHAEMNAILMSNESLEECTIYTWPFAPCSSCSGMIIQSGIKRVVSPVDENAGLADRWSQELDIAHIMFSEAGVILERIYFPID